MLILNGLSTSDDFDGKTIQTRFVEQANKYLDSTVIISMVYEPSEKEKETENSCNECMSKQNDWGCITLNFSVVIMCLSHCNGPSRGMQCEEA